MKLNPRQRWLILGSLLAATIGAGLWLDDEAPEAASSPRERSAASASVARPAVTSQSQGPSCPEASITRPNATGS